MKNRISTTAATLVLLGASTLSSSALVVMLSDTVAAGSALESFLNSQFTNVTSIRHGNYANFSAAASQDALLGTGTFAGMGAADIVIFGRTVTSSAYSNVATGYNNLTIPVVSLTSYIARETDNRLGWHTGSATNAAGLVLTGGNETTVTAAGAAAFGSAAGLYDWHNSPDGSFNGAAEATATFGGGTILASAGSNALSVYWATGSAPANTTIPGQPSVFPGPRLLFNLDNDTNGDLGNLTPSGRNALASALDFYTPLTSVPEPSSTVLALGTLLALSRRRRRHA